MIELSVQSFEPQRRRERKEGLNTDPSMKETEAIIEKIKRINEHFQHLELAVDRSLHQMKPGESVLARIGKHWDPYLREHWWPVGFTGNNKLIIERSGHIPYEPGQIVSLLGPVGVNFRFRRSLRNILLIAYDTPPTPLLMMIHWLLANHVNVTIALLGENAEHYDTKHVSPEVEVIHGDDQLTWPDQVLTLGWADQVFVVVAPDDEPLRFSRLMNVIREKRSEVPKNYIFGVFQSVLPCGIGACDACTVRVEGELKHICTDGPAFDLTLVRLPE